LAAGRPQEALALSDQCLARGLADLDLYRLRGEAAAGAGRPAVALAAFQKVVEKRPSDGAALYNAGTLALRLEDFGLARDYLLRARRIQPRDRDILESLGVACSQLGHHREAEQCFQRLLALHPRYPGGYINLAVVQALTRQFDEALDNLAKARSLGGDPLQIRLNQATIELRWGYPEQAITIYRELLRARPSDPALLQHLEAAHAAAGDWAEAAAVAGRLRDANPDDKGVLCRQAYATARAGDLDAALALLALHQDERDLDILDARAKCLTEFGQVDSALACYRKILQSDPGRREAATAGMMLRQYLPGQDEARLSAEIRRCMADLEAEVRSLEAAPHPAHERLHIGFVSADLRQHSVASFIQPVFEHLDPARLKLHVYDNGRHADELTAALQRHVPHWRYIESLSDMQVAQQVMADEIDILVDLSGLTAGNRLGVFAARPAPVQVTWLGYPATTGLSRMDYRLCDALTDPEGQTEHHYSERLWRLPHIFSVFAPPPRAPAVVDTPALVNGYVTFGSFNNFNKLNEPLLTLWAAILARVADSRLILKSFAFRHAGTRERVYRLFDDKGVSRDRIQILPPTAGQAEHLAQYGKIDIALDTYPYCGTTTSCEALWMGVPLISLVGETHRARVGLTQLTAIGLPELAVSSGDAYVAKAVELAADVPRLQTLRGDMRERLAESPLMDAAGFARDLEQAFEALCRG
jgi:predicted O-linked N-acetylglucosamine transferase (SPINDLY family)